MKPKQKVRPGQVWWNGKRGQYAIVFSVNAAGTARVVVHPWQPGRTAFMSRRWNFGAPPDWTLHYQPIVLDDLPSTHDEGNGEP